MTTLVLLAGLGTPSLRDPPRAAAKYPQALVQIRSQTRQDMGWQEASQFIGERLILLMPELRKRYHLPPPLACSAVQPEAPNS